MSEPYIYYHNNVYGMMTLLNVMKKHGVNRIVFSSTAAVYGEPTSIPIKEDDPTVPTNPYGETKRAMERMMHWFEKAYGIHYVSLRYFNAAGAHPSGTIGEDHDPETHLIPLVLQVASGKRDAIHIYGDDYPTKDGTCIRDYIHVMDLADAHYKALEFLRENNQSEIFNLGSGNGYSVREIIESARKVSGHVIPSTIKPRRAGDPVRLIASNEKAKALLSWKPAHSIETIVRDAWRWHETHPDGYDD